MTSQAYERILTALASSGAKSRDVRQNHSMWQCPAHPDNNPSLGVDDAGDRVMVRCYAGCHTDDVVKELGLTLADLFDGELDTRSMQGQLVRSYLYERPDGHPWFWVDRYFPKTFRQRLPGVEPVRDLRNREETKRLGLKQSNGRARAPIFYHAPKLLAARRLGETKVWWLDGEKDVETAERNGLVATCPPGFAKWDPSYATRLKELGFTEVVLVVDQDKDKADGTLGAGQQGATVARYGFRSVGMRVRTVATAAGKDLTDHFNAGYGAEDFQIDARTVIRPRGIKASELAGQEFAPITWAIPGLLPAGLTIFAGSPKVGKSWVVLDLCAGVAAGGLALGTIPVEEEADTLYLAREDTKRRLQSRLAYLMGGDLDQVPDRLEVVPMDTEWQGGEEGIAHLTEWAEEVKKPRLVVIDTLQRVEPELGEERQRGNVYSSNYTMMARYKQWADTYDVALVMVHHDRKQAAGVNQKQGMEHDPFSKISGTRGLTGAADTLMFLETVRGSGEGQLHISGRDVAEQSLEMHKRGALWVAFDRPEGTH